MSPGREAFQYAVLRAVPRVERGEFINIGIILYCQARDYLAASVSVDDLRLQALTPDVDLVAVHHSAHAVVLACRAEVGSARGNDGLASRFGILTAPRSTVVQPSAVHAGVTDDPATTLGRLLTKLVSTRPR